MHFCPTFSSATSSTNALSLVALAWVVDAHDDGGSCSVLCSSLHQNRIARWNKLQPAKTRTRKAKRLLHLHQEHGTLLSHDLIEPFCFCWCAAWFNSADFMYGSAP